MKEKKLVHLDFEIDKLTNSIENAISGEIFDTSIVKLDLIDSKVIKKVDWKFDWKKELRDTSKLIFKLTTLNNPTIIQGLICLVDKGDHIFMDLIESAHFNKGKGKLYKGVAGNLVAFGCKLSFELNYDGIVSFVAKSQLISHYEQTLGAKLFGGNRMFIDTREASILTTRYFKNFKL